MTRAVGLPEEAKWRYTYDAASNLVEEKGPTKTGVAWDMRYTHDDLNRQVREEDGMGNVTARAYDEVGNRVCEKKAKGQPKLAHGGARGLALAALLLVACEGSHVTRWTYDEESRLVSTRDALEHLTTYTHDALGRRVAEHQHLDKHGRVQARDREWLPRNEKSLDAEHDTGTLTRTWAYDSNGNASLYTDAKGQETHSTWGLLTRLLTREYRKHAPPREWPSVEREAYEYDGNGNELNATQWKRTAAGLEEQDTTWRYDVLDRPVATRRGHREIHDEHHNRLWLLEERTEPETQTLTATEQTRYGYDALDRLVGVAYPDGKAVLYQWDAVGNRVGEREAPASAVTSLGPEAFTSVAPGALTRDEKPRYNRADWLLSREDARHPEAWKRFLHDTNGNLVATQTADSRQQLAWDIRDTLSAVYENQREVGRYDYDTRLRRTHRRTATESVEYVWDGDALLQEREELRGVARRHHHEERPLLLSEATNQGIGGSSEALLLSAGLLQGARGSVTASRRPPDLGLFSTSEHGLSSISERHSLVLPGGKGVFADSPIRVYEYPEAQNLMSQLKNDTCTAACVRMRLADLEIENLSEKIIMKRLGVPASGGISLMKSVARE